MVHSIAKCLKSSPLLFLFSVYGVVFNKEVFRMESFDTTANECGGIWWLIESQP